MMSEENTSLSFQPQEMPSFTLSAEATLRSRAIIHALELARILADNKLFAAGKVSEVDVVAAAGLFYTFLKGQA